MSCNITTMLWRKKSTKWKYSLQSTNLSLQNQVISILVDQKIFWPIARKLIVLIFHFRKFS